MSWVLVTGAAGFVGSHCVRALLEAGHHVVALQRRPTSLLAVPETDTQTFKRLVGDLTRPLTSPVPLTAIVHLAAQTVFPGISASDYAKGNVLATVGLYELAQAHDIRTVIHQSSVSVYGHSGPPALSEDLPCAPEDAYSVSKYLGELIAQDHAQRCRIIITRTPGLVGQGANPNWILSLVEHAVTEKCLSISNADSLFNSTLHVHDYCRFVTEVLASEKPEFGFQCVNLAASQPLAVRQVAEAVLRETRSSAPIIDQGPRKGAPLIETSRAEAQFGFTASTVTQTIQHAVRDFQDALATSNQS